MSSFARLLLALVRRALPGDWADDVARDLEEAYVRRRQGGPGGTAGGGGALAADLWLAGQTVMLIARFAFDRLRGNARLVGLQGGGGALLQDLRYALRGIRRTPFSSGAVIATLAVGIGANSAIFSVVHTVVLDPVPYPEADRLVVTGPYPWAPAPILEDIVRTGRAVEELQAFYPRRFAVTGGDEPAEMEGAAVTVDFLPFLEADVVLGRGFIEADARPGATPVAIVSHEAWRTRLGGSADAVGRTLRIDGVLHEVIGVVEPDFRQLTPRTNAPELWIPKTLDRLGDTALPEGAMPWGIPVARLEARVSMERAQEELGLAMARHREGPFGGEGVGSEGLRWTPVATQLTAPVRPALLLIQAAVGVVLLLACVNVANLLLVRFGSRRSEMAVRTALGASRRRLLRGLVTESVVLALLGGLAGLGLAFLVVDVVVRMAPADVPRIDDVAVDGIVLLFTLAVSVVTGVLFGTVPGLLATRTPPQRVLRADSRAGGSRRGHRLSRTLVVAEVALTLVLVAGAGLLVRTFVSLTAQPPGFRTSDVLTVPLRTPENRFTSVAELETFHSAVLVRLARVPGVAAVGLSNHAPNRRGGASRSIIAEEEVEPRSLQYAVVSPGYFEALDIPLIRGRLLHESDRRDAPPVAVVDEVMARLVWPGGEAVGRRFRFEDDDRWITVVGVTAAIRGSGLDRDPDPGFHIPHRQRPETAVELGVGREAVLLVRTESGVRARDLAPALRLTIHDVYPGQPVPEVRPLHALLADSVAPQRFRALLVGAFAVMALALAIVGIYGVVGQILADRTHELGIRRAVGATGVDAAREVLGWGLRLGALGIAIGLVGVLVLGPALESLLYGVGASDAATLLGSAGALLMVTVTACAIPALRATRVDPITALRRDG